MFFCFCLMYLSPYLRELDNAMCTNIKTICDSRSFAAYEDRTKYTVKGQRKEDRLFNHNIVFSILYFNQRIALQVPKAATVLNRTTKIALSIWKSTRRSYFVSLRALKGWVINKLSIYKYRYVYRKLLNIDFYYLLLILSQRFILNLTLNVCYFIV